MRYRIGFYICHCGRNIAAMVDCPEVATYVGTLANVAVSRDYKYMCSDPGQELIQKDIKELKLNRVVVASCSPLLHEHTFRAAVEAGGLNPFFFHMVNIREHDSWVHTDREEATDKAKALARAAIARVAHHRALEVKKVPIHPDVLVVGGGIAGIHAALTLANAGKKVYLVEREPSIGGHMAKFDKTFPTLDCAACILTPKMSQGGHAPEHHPPDLQPGRRNLRLRRQFQGQDSPQGPVYRRREMHRLLAVHRTLPGPAQVLPLSCRGRGERHGHGLPLEPELEPALKTMWIGRWICTSPVEAPLTSVMQGSSADRRSPVRDAVRGAADRRAAGHQPRLGLPAGAGPALCEPANEKSR